MIFDELEEPGRPAREEEQAAEHRIHVCVAASCVSPGSGDPPGAPQEVIG